MDNKYMVPVLIAVKAENYKDAEMSVAEWMGGFDHDELPHGTDEYHIPDPGAEESYSGHDGDGNRVVILHNENEPLEDE